ncbi:hypothetical protein ACNFG0_14205 [Pseudomonas sp. NY15372]|uniref:hypothetical protein n=1 Tax=Pseudomonas sp. NY15372 TaxID=3400356 RepID=UPI003A879BB6
MKLNEAILKYRAFYVVGYALKIGTLLLYAVSALSFFYWQGRELSGAPIGGHLFWMLSEAVLELYRATVPYIGLIWKCALPVSLTDPLSYGNLGLVGLLAVAIFASYLIKSARALRLRVKRELQRLEEAGWRASAQPSASTTVNATHIGQMNVYNQQLPDVQPDTRMKRILRWVCGILSAYLVTVLAKLTGMV